MIDMGGKFTSDSEKRKVCKANGKNKYIVFKEDNTIYTSTRTLLSHAHEDAAQCNGEIWNGQGNRASSRPSTW